MKNFLKEAAPGNASSGRKIGKLNVIMWTVLFGVVIILCAAVAFLYAASLVQVFSQN